MYLQRPVRPYQLLSSLQFGQRRRISIPVPPRRSTFLHSDSERRLSSATRTWSRIKWDSRTPYPMRRLPPAAVSRDTRPPEQGRSGYDGSGTGQAVSLPAPEVISVPANVCPLPPQAVSRDPRAATRRPRSLFPQHIGTSHEPAVPRRGLSLSAPHAMSAATRGRRLAALTGLGAISIMLSELRPTEGGDSAAVAFQRVAPPPPGEGDVHRRFRGRAPDTTSACEDLDARFSGR